jgi:hypothetical protein
MRRPECCEGLFVAGHRTDSLVCLLLEIYQLRSNCEVFSHTFFHGAPLEVLIHGLIHKLFVIFILNHGLIRISEGGPVLVTPCKCCSILIGSFDHHHELRLSVLVLAYYVQVTVSMNHRLQNEVRTIVGQQFEHQKFAHIPNVDSSNLHCHELILKIAILVVVLNKLPNNCVEALDNHEQAKRCHDHDLLPSFGVIFFGLLESFLELDN